MKLPFLNIAILILVTFTVSAQTADTVKQEQNKFMPTGVRIGTDVIALIKSTTDNTFEGWEVNADVDFNRYYLALDYGSWARTFINSETSYNNDGRYFRIGADVNFLTKDPDRNMFFLGLHYGRATFSENLVLDKMLPPWGSIDNTLINSNINGQWYELASGIKVKMWKFIWLGYTARFKFGLKTNERGDLAPSDVPGYGRADKESYWGFNYQIFFRIPVRKQPVIPDKD